MYDVIVVGARVAGAPTAMLLARAGHRVLLLDRATFPSDKLSTHYIHPAGIRDLESWGLLDQVAATTPPIRKFMVFAGDSLIMDAPMDGIAYCPRRYLLDNILVEAAVASGAELRQGFRVEEIVMDGDRVTGIAGRDAEGNRVEEQAAWVIGAEGHHSIVADAVQAPKYRDVEPLTGGYYSYFSGVDMTDAEVHFSERGGVLAFPTNEGQVCVAAGRSIDQFEAYKADVEGVFFSIIDAAPKFAEKVRGGKREHRWMGSADVPNFFRKPYGPGWALVGDAGYMKDPVTGFGITDAFRDANLLAKALDLSLSGKVPAEDALAEYQQRRDAAAIPIYEYTLMMARGEIPA